MTAAGAALTAPGAHPRPVVEAGAGCAYAPRCAAATPTCREEQPRLAPLEAGVVACLRASELLGPEASR